MIERPYTDGPITFVCDGCAHGVFESETVLFAPALEAAKDAGWKARHMGAGQGWCHFCADCDVPERAQ